MEYNSNWRWLSKACFILEHHEKVLSARGIADIMITYEPSLDVVQTASRLSAILSQHLKTNTFAKPSIICKSNDKDDYTYIYMLNPLYVKKMEYKLASKQSIKEQETAFFTY